MSRVDVQWFGEARLAEITRAADIALQATAAMMGREVVRVLSKTKGQTITTPGQRNQYKASPPGTPPGWRTGRLAGSIQTGKQGHLRYGIGTNVEYARIHELGGTINHPGGTAYIVVGGRASTGAKFVSNQIAEKMEASGNIKLRRTGPHTIHIPQRAFLVPTLRQLEADGTIQTFFSRRFKETFQGNA